MEGEVPQYMCREPLRPLDSQTAEKEPQKCPGQSRDSPQGPVTRDLGGGL